MLFQLRQIRIKGQVKISYRRNGAKLIIASDQ